MMHARSCWLLIVLVASACARAAAQDQDPLAGLDLDRQERASSPQKTLPRAALDTLLARYDREPTVEQVARATLQAASGKPQHFADMASRSRLRALIPHLDLGLRRGQGIDQRFLTPTDDLADNRTTADDLMLFATLRFDLDRLLFTNEEVSMAREERFAHDAQHELIRKVVHVYFLRKRLLLERDLADGNSIAQQLRIQEAEALLNAFTDGAFQRMLDHSRATWKTGAGTNASERR